MLALALRGLWIARTDTQLPMLGDPEYYHATAQNIAEGRGYSVECCDQGFKAGDDSEATAFWSPGFPMALAPFYKLFGSDIHVGKLFNAVAGALTVIPIFLLARRLTDSASRSEVVGLFAAFLFAVMPSLVFWTSALLSEPLCGLGIASTLVIAMWAGERGSIVGFVITASCSRRRRLCVLRPS